MKKLITFALGYILFLPSIGWSINAPTIIWPTQDGYYVAPGANQLFQVQTNIANCDAILTLYSIESGVKVPISTKNVHADKKFNHKDVYFSIPECLLTKDLCLGVRNVKNGSFSIEVFRTLKTDDLQISIPYPIPFLQFKCSDDPWEPIIPKGCITSLSNPNPNPTTNYNGFVTYFEGFQDPFNAYPIATTDNGTGFSPYLLPYTPQQQEAGGVFKYTIPSPPCRPKGDLFNQMLFARIEVPYFPLQDNLHQKVVNPELLPCAQKTKCNLPQVTFVYLPGPSSINIPGGEIIDVKYYYTENGQLYENTRMSDAGTILGYSNPISKKIVCYQHLLNPDNTAELRNYIIEYTISTSIYVLGSSFDEIPVTCKIRIPASVNPVDNQALIYTVDAAQTFLDGFNSLMNKFGQLPGVNEALICDLIFTLFDVIPNGIDRNDDVNFMGHLEQTTINRYTNLIDFVSKDDHNLKTYWIKDNELKFSSENFYPQSEGHYQLFMENEYGMSIEIYTLDIVRNETKSSLNLKDVIDDSLFQVFHSNLPDELKNKAGLKNEHSEVYLEFKKKSENRTESSSMFRMETNQKIDMDQVSINPNPTKNLITLKNKSNTSFSGMKYIIYSIDGREKMVGNINEENSIDIQQLNSGSYILTLSDQEGSIKSLKFTKL